MPGMVGKRYNPVVIALAARFEKRGLTPKSIIGARMRKLVHLIYGVVKSELELQEGI
ncbi:hypothetical protein LCGC14_0192480 [marine sediment metagenome]|uniref:Uncharacterized protein n=1 Tax=marine sediment metagenome TaxID=412755 RepID=A0A0F9UQN2_9ZZZZ